MTGFCDLYIASTLRQRRIFINLTGTLSTMRLSSFSPRYRTRLPSVSMILRDKHGLCSRSSSKSSLAIEYIWHGERACALLLRVLLFIISAKPNKAPSLCINRTASFPFFTYSKNANYSFFKVKTRKHRFIFFKNILLFSQNAKACFIEKGFFHFRRKTFEQIRGA